MPAPQHVTKQHRFAVMTVHTIPEALKNKTERTNYGWESMKVKTFIRVPIADGVADSAYMSMMNFNAKMKDQWTDAHNKEYARIVALDEVKAIEDDEERNNHVIGLMRPWLDENGEEPVRYGHQPAVDSKGRYVKHKKGGADFEFVNYDDPDGEALPKDKRDNEKPAFRDFIRVV